MVCRDGYRPHRSVHTAIRAVSKELQHGKYSYIVEADIKGFFDNIDHDLLIRILEKRIDDPKFIGLIKKWLKAGVLEPNAQIINPKSGTPQGGSVSPILANIYLHHVLDTWFEEKIKFYWGGESATYLCRYADDFICAFRFKKDALEFMEKLKIRFKEYNLELAEEKTNLISFSRFRKEEKTCFDFLGFEFRWGVDRRGKDSIRRRTSRKKLRNPLKI